MLAQTDITSSKKQVIPVPKGTNFSGPLADRLAKFAFLLMVMTSTQDERMSKGYFIPFSKELGVRHFGRQYWHKVRKAAIMDYGHVFEFNDRYSNCPTKSFCKSVRLREPYRQGLAELYQFQRKQTPVHMVDNDRLDPVSRKLAADFRQFWLPDQHPMFTNPWQAFSWSRISNCDFYAHRCDFGRFHSNFTAFKHRYAVQYRKPLSRIDVTACQPLILGKVASEQTGDTADLAKWNDIYAQGDLYQFFAERLQVTRGEAKESLVICIFQQLKPMVKMPVFEVMRQEFPSLAQYLMDRKKVWYQTVAHDCQRFESRLLIDRCVARLRKVPLLTVHDEFIVPTDSVEQVQRVMESEFAREGMRARFRIQEL